tara:strand:- start:1796 stop:2692 length:897 start_codon:yes stop_codon:yes gene_type:complete
MKNKKPFSFHYLSSEKLRQINFSLTDFALFFIFLLAVSVGVNYYLSVKFSTDYYKVKIDQAEKEYSDISQELLDKVDKMEKELALLEEKDGEMRTYAALPPINEDIKEMGTGGSEIEKHNEDDPSTILDKLKNTIDSLSYTLDAQKNSYDIIFNKIKSNEKMYRHIPSIMPVESAYLGSQYGYRTDPIDGKRRMHRGQDFAVNLNTSVLATGDGVVTKAQYDSGWGRYIKIDHGYGYETIYAHLYKINVKKGQKIKRGDVIGKSGNSGRAAGFHLHYEVHKNKKVDDPKKYFFLGYIK